jgi:hypothetical protein
MVQMVERWIPLATNAVEAYCSCLPEASEASNKIMRTIRDFHASCGL